MRWLGLGLLVLAVGVAFYLRGPSTGDSPEHRSDSDAANGTSALRQLAGALDHPTLTFDSAFGPDAGVGLVFVFTPTTAFSREDANRLGSFVAGGGTVVYASEQGDPRLDGLFGLNRRPLPVGGDATGVGALLRGVGTVRGAAAVRPLQPSSTQVPLLRAGEGLPIAIEERMGKGRVVALADPLELCNGYLDRADDGRLASDLLSLAGPQGSVAFDEYHHGGGLAGTGSPVTAWLSSSWGAAITWAVLTLFVGLALRGRAFGPRLALPGGGDRSSGEYVNAVGELLRRSRAGWVTAQLLEAATRRRLAARFGVEGSGRSLDQALARLAPALAAELVQVDGDLAEVGGDEARLLEAARRLHRLAYPEEVSR